MPRAVMFRAAVLPHCTLRAQVSVEVEFAASTRHELMLVGRPR